MHKYDYDIMHDASVLALKSTLKYKHGCIIIDKKGKEDFIWME